MIMKLTFILLISFFLVTSVFSQSKKPDSSRVYKTHMRFSLYKENGKIDSLMNVVLKESHFQDTYFVFVISGRSEPHLFGLFEVRNNKNSVVFNPAMPNNRIWAFFNFKNRTIFIAGVDDPLDFFEKTDKTKKFNFKWPASGNLMDYVSKRLYSTLYEYKNGKFTYGLVPAQ